MNGMKECVNDRKSFENLFYGMWNANIINLTRHVEISKFVISNAI
jgi:hypothetical protein